MVKKVCCKCKKELDLSDFYLRKTGKRQGKYYEKCKNCMKLRGRSYYHLNHERQLELAKKRNQRNLKKSLRLLIKAKNKPCIDCGGHFPPWVMDFDHKDNASKSGNVSQLRRSHNFRRIETEIQKCDLLCANCHRSRTVRRFWGKYYAIIEELKTEGYRFFWENQPR